MEKLKAQIFTVIACMLLTGCLGTRFLKEDEKLLYKQKIEGAKGLDPEKLESFYQFSPNRRLPVVHVSPYVYLYQMGLRKYNTERYEEAKKAITEQYTGRMEQAADHQRKVQRLRAKMNNKLAKMDKALKEGNLPMRWGEALAVYDQQAIDKTRDQLDKYLHSSGYFNATVTTTSSTKGKLVSIGYQIQKNTPYIIDSMFYQIADSNIKALLLAKEKERMIKKGDIYDQEKLTAERDRINELMVNNGYYAFSRQYVAFEVDTASLGGQRVAIKTLVLAPPDAAIHRQYRIDSVFFTTDSDLAGMGLQRQREVYNNIVYRYYQRQYAKKIIDWRFFIHPGDLYSREKTFESQRQLSNLDIYKFINIKYDTTGGQFIANVFASPLKKFQLSTEMGVNVSQGLPGPFVNGSLKVRNVFKGLESMSLSGKFGIEGVASATEQSNVYSSVEYGANMSVVFPQFLFPLGRPIKSRLGPLNPRTRVTAGVNYTDRPEYLRNNINTRIEYTWQKNTKRQYTFTPGDFSIIESRISAPFDSLLNLFAENGNNLRNSFLPSFVSATSLAMVYNFNNYGNKQARSAYLRLFAESGGTFLGLFDELPIGNNLEYYQWVKLSADYRQVRPLRHSAALAYRLHVGLAYAYGDNETLPYEKFFFAGGSNSIRAWRPRRLGPGSHRQTDAEGNPSTSFEQPGDIIVESSVEFRHKIVGFMHGAVFADAGNVWTLRSDPNRPGAEWSAQSFLRSMAVGAGYGLRFDFSFLILRFDAALKIYDPSRSGGSFIWQTDPTTAPYTNRREVILNLGIGHAF